MHLPTHKEGRIVSSSASIKFYALAAFALLVALTGGSSRSDIPSLMLLRPAALVFCFGAMSLLDVTSIKTIKGALMVVLAIMLTAALQLVPLPAWAYQRLPFGPDVANADLLVGTGGAARPLSLAAHRTWNMFFAMFVPLAAICLVAIQSVENRRRVIPILMAIGFLSAAFGYLQATGGNGLHLYRITHLGFPVGLFANKNHQAVTLLWVMLGASWLAATHNSRQISGRVRLVAALGTMLVLFPLLVLTGSRAALALSPAALALSAWLLHRSPATGEILRRAGKRAGALRALIVAILISPLAFVFVILATSSRETALSRLFELEAVEDVRVEYMPILWDMMRDAMPWGFGFGSFESTVRIYESAAVLSPRYMNQAHNDFVQLAIEGGIPAIAIASTAVVWYLWRCLRLWVSGDSIAKSHAIFFSGSLGLFLGASVVDYPLRTPLAAMLLAALTAQLCFLSTPSRSKRDVSRHEP
jgi:O-antigen ligase